MSGEGFRPKIKVLWTEQNRKFIIYKHLNLIVSLMEFCQYDP